MSTWFYWILPVILVVRWSVLWRRTRRVRLRFTWLSPLGAIAGVFLGLALIDTAMDRASCFGDDCRGDVAGFTASLDANAGLGGLILANSVLAFLIAVVLAVVTLMVEAALLIRRRGRARQSSV